MVDIVPNSQKVIGHGAFSIVSKAILKSVRLELSFHHFEGTFLVLCINYDMISVVTVVSHLHNLFRIFALRGERSD